MSTGIQWTDETWNPVVGCDPVSPGCAHCYAKELHDKRHRAHVAGRKVAPQYAEPFETVQLKPERLDYPLGWRKPKRIFVNSVSDLFHDDVPDEYIAQVFAIMALARWHTFQVLTKRAARMQALLSSEEFRQLVAIFVSHYAIEHSDPLNRRRDDLRATAPDVEGEDWPLPNVWLGVSVENRRWANERIPLLVQTRAAVRFLSCEPLLGPIDFDEAGSRGAEDGDPFAFSALRGTDGCEPPIPGIDWVIVGGESGGKARPFDLAWARAIITQCRAAGVTVFVKQLGTRPIVANDSGADAWPGGTIPFADDYEPHHQGELAPLKLHDGHGGDPDEWPEELRVREFPASEVHA